jgi:hypothetical protein
VTVNEPLGLPPGSLTVADLEGADFIAVKLPHQLTAEQLTRLGSHLRDRLKTSLPIIFLENGATIEVVRNRDRELLLLEQIEEHLRFLVRNAAI